ncbi:MAG: hypothetical protein V1889_00445 [archaeon]
MAKGKEQVLVTNQSFRGAGGLELFPGLEMGEMLLCRGNGEYHGGKESAFRKAIELLKGKADREGCSCVFGVRFKILRKEHCAYSCDEYYCEVYGTGYRTKS